MTRRALELATAFFLGMILMAAACKSAHADQGNPLADMQAAFCPPTAQTWERHV